MYPNSSLNVEGVAEGWLFRRLGRLSCNFTPFFSHETGTLRSTEGYTLAEVQRVGGVTADLASKSRQRWSGTPQYLHQSLHQLHHSLHIIMSIFWILIQWLQCYTSPWEADYAHQSLENCLAADPPVNRMVDRLEKSWIASQSDEES